MACSGKSNMVPCGQSFPESHCCPSDAKCLPIFSTNGTPVTNATICCPIGSDCDIIRTVTCDITQYNATLHPENQMHAEPDIALGICGTECCPPGYDCKSGTCFLVSGAKEAIPSESVTLRISSSTTSVPSATAVTTLTPLSSPLSSPVAPRPSSGRNSITVVALGSALGGVFVLSLIVGFLLVRRYDFPFRRSGSGMCRHKEKKSSWNKPELEDTQKQVVYAELGAGINAHELRAGRDVSELPCHHSFEGSWK
jgi:hypothetical protein